MVETPKKTRLTIAVMQPYFAPYAGYYRLLAGADVFVIYDCVQFPRRGWVHRNRLPDAAGEPAWLTLPLDHAPFEAKIADLTFAPDAAARLAERLRAFPSMLRPFDTAMRFLHAAPFEGMLVDYLEAQLRVACDLLGMQPRLLRSSSLTIPETARGQDRILAIAAALGATDYLNAPGGRDLYDADVFGAAGVTLRFLEPYQGSSFSLLHRLATAPVEAVAAELVSQTPAPAEENQATR